MRSGGLTVRLTDGDGGYAGLLSVGEDITDRLTAEWNLDRTRHEMERIGRANMLGELVSTLAHELSQPLAAILSNAQAARRFLASGNADPDELREILDDIVRDDKRAGDVIQHLRLLLRTGEVAHERFAVQEPVRDVLALMNGEFDAQGITVQQDLPPDLPLVDADAVETQQVIMNLLVNAAQVLSKASPKNRKIRIRAERDRGNAVVVSIEDTGPGILPDALARLFEPFFTTRSGGLGMGLAICRRIIEAHGGRIRGEDTGTGARFSFTLPVARREPRHD